MINRRAAAAAAVTATLALGALAAPASAAPQNAAAGGPRSQASASGMPATLHEVTAAHVGNAVAAPSGAAALKNRSVSPAFSSCSIYPHLAGGGYTGFYICDTDVLYRYLMGRLTIEEVFVIGTNWQIWHAWPGSNGWHSLGGAALHKAPGNGVYLRTLHPYAIYTYGTDGRQWCDNWGTPTWGGWHLC
jgi:hypothetical protein